MRRDADPLAAASFHQKVQRLVRTHGRATGNVNYQESRKLVVGEIVISEVTAKNGRYGLAVYRCESVVYSYTNDRGRSEIRFTYDAVERARAQLDTQFVLESLSEV